MITRLRVVNFKRFADADIPLRAITVLTGLNGTGKSTLIQAVLLARQAAEGRGREIVQLNGAYNLGLGEANEVLHVNAQRPEIDVTLVVEEQPHLYRFGVPEASRRLNLPVVLRPAADPEILLGRGMGFTYLTAERLGPRDQLDVSAEEQRLVGVGIQGEFTGQAISTYETVEVREPLRHARTGDSGVVTLRTQLEYWASDVIRPIQISANWPPGITATVVRFQDPATLGEPIRPSNMGFGLSYALPILVAGLLAPVGGLLMVENPEAHLHPAGQSKLGRFLAMVAGAGAQVIVETHSDHVLNGIRLAATEDRAVRPSDVAVYFFGAGSAEPATPIEVNARGELSTWPDGFFDQMDEDLARLSRVRRAN
jgi:predicted ATPase